MYARNSASPERIAIGPVVTIADGSVIGSGATIAVIPQGGSTGAGGGTTSYENGIVCYLPTQAETNYTSFMVVAFKTGCIPACATIVTSASAVSGYAGLDWAKINAPTTAQGLTGTTIAVTQKVDVETIKTQAVTCAAGVTVAAHVGAAAAAGASGGLLISGSNTGTTTFGALTVTGATTFTGATTHTGLVTLSNGLKIDGGAQGTAALLTGTTTGHGISATGAGTTGAGLYVATGAGAAAGTYGLMAIGNGASDSGGFLAKAVTSGEGMEAVAAGNGHGFIMQGAGTGEGLQATGGAGAQGCGATFSGGGNAASSGILISGGAGGGGLAIDTIKVSGATTLTGNVSFGGTFSVAGAVTYNSFTCSNGMTVSGASGLSVSTLVSTGVVTLASLGVSGTTTLTGNVTMGGAAGLAVTNGITANITGNITGTLATVTNLTNAPSVGDFTAAMKSSIIAAAWDTAIAGHVGAGTTGASLNAAGAGGDPWLIALPGAYVAGTAGATIGALTFTKANELDVNTKSINDVTITGNGVAPNEFGV